MVSFDILIHLYVMEIAELQIVFLVGRHEAILLGEKCLIYKYLFHIAV